MGGGGIDRPFQRRQGFEGLARHGAFLVEEGDEEVAGQGATLVALRPADPDAVIAPIQKNLDEGAAGTDRLMKGALAPVLEPEQCRLDVLAGSQAIDAVVGAVATVDRFGKRAYLDTIALSFAGVDPIATKKPGIRRLGFDPKGFIEAPQMAAFDFIGVTGGPAGWPGPLLRVFPLLLCFRHGGKVWYRWLSILANRHSTENRRRWLLAKNLTDT